MTTLGSACARRMINVTWFALFLFLLPTLAVATFTVKAQANTQYFSPHPFTLLQQSIRTPSAAERAIIRSHLAKAHPHAAEGLFAAAWLSGVDGKTDDEIRLYEAAIAADPELTVAYLNLGFALERAARPEAARDVYDSALSTAPFEGDLVRNGFFVRKNQLKDRDGAAAFLQRWEREVGHQEHAFDYVRGIDAEQEGKYAEAERLYLSAIEKGAPFEAREQLSTLRWKKLSDNKTPISVRLPYIIAPLRPLLESRQEAAAYHFMGRLLSEELGARRPAVEYLKQGFVIHPTAEVAEEIFLAMSHHDMAGAQAFLEEAQQKLPGNYLHKASLAWLNYNFLAHPDKAVTLARESLSLAPHDEGRLAAVITTGAALQSYGRIDEAYDIYRDQLRHPWSAARRRHLLQTMVDNRIAAQKFSEAKAHLDDLQSSGSVPAKWHDWKHSIIDTALSFQERPKEPLIPDSLAVDWNRTYGDDQPVRVGFAVGSARLSAKVKSHLDRVAGLLRSTVNAKTTVSIEGHADATGAAEFNDALSARRAREVLNYLQQRHGIDGSRLQVSAFGSRYPVASNRKRVSRRQNRRVEIRPLPASSSREAALPDAFRGTRFTQDTYQAIIGSSPPQIWDTRTKTKLVDLYRGRNHRFSPDDRYVASLSSYEEPTGQTTEAIYIHDARTGNVVAQLIEPHEIIDLAWRPDSGAFAFSTADGFLKLYDLNEHRIAAVTRMGTVRIGGPLAWHPDGSALASGQHRLHTIVIHDPITLAETRRLEGVNWPHAMGFSRDGRNLVVFDNRRDMSVWRTRDWRGPRKAKAPVIPLDLEFHPDRPYVAINARFEASDTSLAVMDFQRMKIVSSWADAGTYSIGMTPAGETLQAVNGDESYIFDIPSLRLQGNFKSPRKSGMRKLEQKHK